MKKKKNNVNIETIIAIIIVLLVVGLSIGWSSFSSSLQIDSMAMVRIKSDIRVTGFNYSTGTTGVISLGEEYNVRNGYGTVTLPNADSTVKYQVEITNMELASNVHMGINSITGLPNNLEIKSIEDYSLKDKICDDNNSSDCGSGAQKTFYITIGYKNGSYDASNLTHSFTLDFEFKRVHDIIYTGFTYPPISPTTVIDGDTPTISFSNDAGSILNIIMGGVTLIQGTNYTYSNHVLTFITPIRDNVSIVNPSIYTITYVLNGGVQAAGQITTYSTLHNETILSPTREGYTFDGWYQESDFSGTIVNSTSQLSGNTTLYASWIQGNVVARIGSTYYNTMQDAINAVPTNNSETTIVLLSNIQEYLSVSSNKNITFNLQNYTISSVSGKPIIETNGTIRISDGIISSNTTQGAINVNTGGVLYMSGGMITTTGNKQAIYVDGGTAYISGTANLRSTSNQRACVQNQSNGTLVITGGNIRSTQFSGVQNAGSLTIGSEDGVANRVPVITGFTYGVNSTVNYTFYDGIINGKTDAVNDETKITDVEDNYVIYHNTDEIDGVIYKSISFIEQYTVTFDPNGGTVDEPERIVRDGYQVGILPVPVRTNYLFEGWFTAREGGRQIAATEVITADIDFFAHWIDISQVVVAMIGNDGYSTLQEAIDAAPNRTETTITLVHNTIENVIVASNKNIVFDLGGYTLSNSTAVSAITNKGTAKLISGTVTSNSATASAINNDPGGTFTMTGGSVIATGKRQAIYNDGGTVTISGMAYLSSKAVVENNNKRGTVQNLANGTLYILGGTIESFATNGVGFNNLGTASIGIKDGSINSSSPIVKGAATGVNNTGTLNFYDGILKGTTNTVNGTISDEEDNSVEVNNTEIIDGVTYHTLTLALN